ncbi:hypothetical protein [Alkanindiges illinoisensis]|uniref:hypothetical protein n=1 Tax=Alkanindiges illinoisensis TaxID=197183 RepID=UPI00047EF43D|nr:hypothetical protein [Alkanindiges illinoisensis]
MEVNKKDALLILNGSEPYVILDDITDAKIKSFNCKLGYCPWIAQPELLVRANLLIGLTYIIPDQYMLHVLKWVEELKSAHVKVSKIVSKKYYKIEDYSNQYMFEVYWILQEPDAKEGLALTEDFWLLSQNSDEDSLNNVFAIGLSNPHEVAQDHDLEWKTELIKS